MKHFRHKEAFSGQNTWVKDGKLLVPWKVIWGLRLQTIQAVRDDTAFTDEDRKYLLKLLEDIDNFMLPDGSPGPLLEGTPPRMGQILADVLARY